MIYLCRKILVLTFVFTLWADFGPLKLVSAQDDAVSEQTTRVLHFPEDRSLGTISIQDVNPPQTIAYDWISDITAWQIFCPAQGNVIIPAGKRVLLKISPEASRDLSPLASLQPDDIYSISFQAPGPTSPYGPARDVCMKHISHLVGLKKLQLGGGTIITDKGLIYIVKLKSLEKLTLPDRITNAGLAYVAKLTSLKTLHFTENKVTNAGLAQLAPLRSLEKMVLGGQNIGDAGLVPLAQLPALKDLHLWGTENFTDAGMVYLQYLPSLRNLNLAHLPLTDKALPHLGKLHQLENLNLYNTFVTDKGFVHLTSMRSLKKLNIDKRANNITRLQTSDKGMIHIQQIKSLEHLEIFGDELSDVGLTRLSELPHLKSLMIIPPHYSDPKMDNCFYTDKGLEHLARINTLENLHIGSPVITDKGLAQLEKLTKLKSLLIDARLTTKQGLAHLANLKALNYLTIRKTTISGLNQLNGLTGLKYLKVYTLIRDNTTLNISGLTNLEVVGITTSLEDKDLACLVNLTKLRDLQISPHKGISDAGMVHLQNLTQIWRISIGGEEVTDQGLKYLAGMKNLNTVNITGNFSDKALLEFERFGALSSLTIRNPNGFSRVAIQRLMQKKPNLRFSNPGEENRH